MSTLVPYGDRIAEIELLDLFKPEEATIDQIYGKVRQGKNYLATRNILSRLRSGSVEYANWQIKWDGYDQRDNIWLVLLGVCGFKRRFYRFDKSNFRQIQIDDSFLDTFEKLTDCVVNLDEGHVIFDSYEHAKMSMRKRQSILATGHFGRRIVIISQRPTAIHVTARGNVNRFFKVEKLLQWPFLLFKMTEFQDMIGETVDESKPERSNYYFGLPSIYKAYDTHYLRGGLPDSQHVNFEAYSVNYLHRWVLAGRAVSASLRGFWPRRRSHKAPTVAPVRTSNYLKSIS